MKILIASDAWPPQINGVVRTLDATATSLRALGVDVELLTGQGMWSVGLPSYPGIRLALPRIRSLFRRIDAARPDAIHIATEGPIGLATRHYCRSIGRPFTTSFHTRFADYVSARWPIPTPISWAGLRWFHNGGRCIMASTSSLAQELSQRGFRAVAKWPRGVDTGLFRPDMAQDITLQRPIFLTVGRLSVEKNLDAFLSLDLPGTKLVVGDGPARATLERRYPDAHFIGVRHGAQLAAIYAGADAFVFPSLTDTYGLVLLEALASGTPVAAFALPTTRDVIGTANVAALDDNLRDACLAALTISRADCRAYAETMSWEASAQSFLRNIRSVLQTTP